MEPPKLQTSERKDPLQELIVRPQSANPQPGSATQFRSPAPRVPTSAIKPWSHGSQPNTGSNPRPIHPYAAANLSDVSAFNRSEVAQQIRNSFDALVRASPIGGPMMARRFASPSPYHSAPRTLHPNGHTPASAEHQQIVRTSEIRHVVQTHSPVLNTVTSTIHVLRETTTAAAAGAQQPLPTEQQQVARPRNTVICEELPHDQPPRQQQQQQPASPKPPAVIEPVDNNAIPSASEPGSVPAAVGTTTENQSLHEETEQPQQQQQQLTRPPNIIQTSSKTPTGNRRKASLPPRPHSASAALEDASTAAATMPIRLPTGGIDHGGEGVFEVTRFGRPRVKPLAYWSSERLVVGDKSAGATGIDRGSMFGDLLGLSGVLGGEANINNQSSPARQLRRASHTGGKRRSTASGKATAEKSRLSNKKAVDRDAIEGAIEEVVEPITSKRSKASEPLDDAPAAQQGGQTGRSKRGKNKKNKDNNTNKEDTSLAALAAAAGAAAATTINNNASVALPRRDTDAKPISTSKPKPSSAQKLGSIDKSTPYSSKQRTPAAPSAEKQQPDTQQRKFDDDGCPIIQGVPKEIIQEFMALDGKARRRCGYCPTCLRPAAKQACQLLKTIRNMQGLPQQVRRRKSSLGGNNNNSNTPVLGALSTGKKRKAAGEGNASGSTAKKRGKAGAMLGQNNDDKNEQGAGGPRRSNRQRTTFKDLAPESDDEDPRAKQPVAAEEVKEGDVWTTEQVEALQRAWLDLPPTAANFWQKVAATVPGKTASQCFAKMYERHPTPTGKKNALGAGAQQYLAASRGEAAAAPLPEVKPGASKAAVYNAARKMARQARWKQRAEEVAAADGDEEELVDEMEEQSHRDKYIDQILRKRRGRALGGVKEPVAAARGALYNMKAKAGGSDTAKEVEAALAAGNKPEDDRLSGEESDYYWSESD